MTPIVSKRHPINFYFTVGLAILLCIAMASAIIFDYINSLDKGQLKPKEIILPILVIACFALAGYSLYRYIKNTPTITLDKDFIKFNSQTYSTADIDKIEFTGKQPFKFVINFPMEAAALKFKNGDTKYIFDDMYSNSWAIKSFLKQVVIDKKELFERNSSAIDKIDIVNGFYVTFKGNQFTSFNGIVLWGLIAIFLIMGISSTRPVYIEFVLFASCFSLMWFLAFSYQMHYFQVSDNYLLIRNHNFFWKKVIYRIDDIKEIVFETKGKLPNCLRVITKDFESKLYPAATLRVKNWLELKDKMENYKIEVRNECVL